MKDNEALLHAVVESSQDAICATELDGTITLWNGAAERLLGYSAAETIGRTIETIIPDERRAVEQIVLGRARAGHSVEQHDTVRRRRDGGLVEVVLRISPVFGPDGALVGLSHFLRERGLGTLLERRAQHLGALVESSDDAIASKDLDGIVQSWNPAAERLFGYRADEIIGQSIRTIIPHDRWPEEDEVLRRIRAGDRVDHFETVRQRKDGSLVPISLTVSPIRSLDGRIIGASKIARDLTALHAYATRLEQMVQERTSDLQRANAQLEAFAYSVSHDLRAPLRGMQGLSQALLEDYGDSLDETARDYARRIVSEASLLDRLIQDLLAYSRLSRLDLTLERIDSRHIVDAALRQLQDEISATGARIEIAPDLPAITANRTLLVQVLTNLLSNAIKFGGERPLVRIRAERSDGCARLWVEDSGIGIEPQHHERIFGAFERLHSADRYPGTGIGLAIVRRSIERLGGRVGVESQVGHGSRFWIELPVVEAA